MTDIFDPSYEENIDIKISDNTVSKGDDVNLMAKDPTIREIVVGAGWQANVFGGEMIDVDLSCFLLNKDDLTRIDDDFVFYNNKEACDGGVVYNGDNLIGAGEGDIESISINLESVPFGVNKIVFTLSLYKGDEKNIGLADAKNFYLRIVNATSGHEILRYNMAPDIEGRTETAVIVANINRQGPKWHFEVIGECIGGGLGKIATDYGMIIHQG